MSAEEIINEDLEIVEERPSRPDKRYTDLTEKVKTTAEERDQLAAEKAALEAEREAAKKDAEFYKNFNTVASKYDGATEYQDKIKEKVDSGYDLEDAAIAILAKEGRLAQAPAPITRESPAGGSATTTLVGSSDKPLSEMTTAEKRAALEQIEKESGGVSHILRNGL